MTIFHIVNPLSKRLKLFINGWVIVLKLANLAASFLFYFGFAVFVARKTCKSKFANYKLANSRNFLRTLMCKKLALIYNNVLISVYGNLY